MVSPGATQPLEISIAERLVGVPVMLIRPKLLPNVCESIDHYQQQTLNITPRRSPSGNTLERR